MDSENTWESAWESPRGEGGERRGGGEERERDLVGVLRLRKYLSAIFSIAVLVKRGRGEGKKGREKLGGIRIGNI